VYEREGGLYSWQSASRWIRAAMDGMDERSDRGGEARDGMDGWKDREETAIGWAPLGDGMKLRAPERHIGPLRQTIAGTAPAIPPRIAVTVRHWLGCGVWWTADGVGRHAARYSGGNPT